MNNYEKGVYLKKSLDVIFLKIIHQNDYSMIFSAHFLKDDKSNNNSSLLHIYLRNK